MQDKSLSTGLSLAVFLCSSLVLTVHHGISYGAIPLLLMALVTLSLKGKSCFCLEKTEKRFIFGLCALPIAAVFSIIVNSDWQLSLFDEFSRFLLVIPIFLAIKKVGINRNLLFIGFIVGAIGAGSFGFYQKYLLGHAVAQGFLHKIMFGDISLILGVLSLSYWIGYRDPGRNSWILLLAIIGFGFGLLGSVCSGTRGGWIALPFLLWLLLSHIVESKRLKHSLYAGGIAALLLIYNFNGLVNSKVDNAVHDFVEYFTEDNVVGHGSVSSRFEMWKGALIMFKESPITGVGINNYTPRLIELQKTQQIRLPSAKSHPHAHNDFLRLLSEVGIAGGLAYIALFLFAVKLFLSHSRQEPQIAAAGLVLCLGFIDFSLTDALLRWNAPTTFLAILLATLAGQLGYLRQHVNQPELTETDRLELKVKDNALV